MGCAQVALTSSELDELLAVRADSLVQCNQTGRYFRATFGGVEDWAALKCNGRRMYGLRALEVAKQCAKDGGSFLVVPE